MKTAFTQSATGLLLAATLCAAAAPARAAADHDAAVGQVMAASRIAKECKGIATLGSGDAQSFVIAASDVLAKQGYRAQKLRKLLFYGQTAWLNAQGEAALVARGVKAGDRASLCGFGHSIAGKNDQIGQFLVKGN